MFQRLVVAGEEYFSDSSELFKYELASILPAIFDNHGFLREAAKSSLAETLWNTDHCLAESYKETDQCR